MILPDFMSKLINSSVDLKSDEDVESNKESVQQEQNQSDNNKEDFSNSSKEDEPINKNITEETTAEPYEESSNTLEDKSEIMIHPSLMKLKWLKVLKMKN